MRRFALGALSVVVIAGCQGSDSTSSEVVVTAPAAVVTAINPPNTDKATTIGIVVQKDTPICVGTSAEEAFREFRDPKQYGNEYNDLPPQFKYPYRARTWETADFGFGEILHNDTLVAAMYHEDKVPQDRVDELVKAHQNQVGAPPTTTFVGKKVSYWFWELTGQRLMICAFQSPNKNKGLEITIAMGDDVVMDGLGISPNKAQTDIQQVDSALRGLSMREAPAVGTR